MKRIYIQPSMKLANAFAPQIIATSGDASETHWGGNDDDNPLHPDPTPDMKGTGDDDDFTLHSKYRKNFYGAY